ncbi:MAG: nitrite reductase [Bacteroidetes bacterium GWE2_39_28]|mgnify:CR=1 FL=1|jgi:NAD(P)H-nitrite reductase large subunit|nr:(2Fe-2S)-binding protein [Bacteroidales bacterium]OFX77540.1 MAG: nitrite reductase [Bacteroidetes bacterium GWE2_39_28]OFY13682.1 MAG: nitrite reductase [Bacteroidetes bacterium GWF2_39_10]OFZ10609.1 MAG: nitrite reductase [Bacteroidetes bacterium RIFOXYC2_FULL_39_11]PKO96262.1 MAG: (2Fe-2S)-binding protein [Bacteroidetes bacterium HGW-Bacteroidetes-7]HCV14998.1 (2Fe-2S)-binding protein [Rikenellaceae bacterium]
MSERRIICNCNEVYNDEIIKAIQEKGCKTVEDIGEETGAGTICGGCVDDIQEILDEYAGK